MNKKYKLPRILTKYKKLTITPYDYLKRLKPAKGYKYDEEEGEKVINWIEENCHYSSNEWEGQPFKLHDWQKLMLSKFYGFVKKIKIGDQEKKVRQFRDLFLFIPKKNGKTELAAALVLYHLIGDDEPDPKLFSIAVVERQSALVYKKAVKMLKFNKKWKNDEDNIYSRLKPILRIVNEYNSGEFQVLTSKAVGTQGISPSLVVCDELHEAQNTALFDSVASPYAAAARRQPVNLLFTTGGYDISGLVQLFLNLGKGIMSGRIKDNIRLLPVIFQSLQFNMRTADQLAKVVNPGYFTGLLTDEYFTEGLRFAKTSDERLDEHGAYVLNILREKDKINTFIPMDKFKACQVSEPKEINYLNEVVRKYTLVAGLDFGSKSDFTSFVVVALNPEDGKYYIKIHTWVTQPEIKRQIDKKVPFKKWRNKGYFEPDVIEVFNPDMLPFLLNQKVTQNQYNIIEVRFDPSWVGNQMREMNKSGLFYNKCIPAKVTMTGLNEAHNRFLGLIMDNQIVFEKNEMLDWCASNCFTKSHPQGYKHIVKQLNKNDESKKIDPIMAMILAVDAVINQEKKQETLSGLQSQNKQLIEPLFKGVS